MTAGELIEESRDYHPRLDRRAIPSLIARRKLSRILAARVTELAAETPDPLAVLETFDADDLAAAMAGDGTVEMPAYVTLCDVRAFLDDTGEQVEMEVARVALGARLRHSAPFPSVVAQNEALLLTDLRLIGRTEHGWEDVEELRVRYVPLPEDLATDADEVAVPDGLRGLLVADLAIWMMGRLDLDASEAKEDRDRCLGAFLGTVALQERGGSWNVGG